LKDLKIIQPQKQSMNLLKPEEVLIIGDTCRDHNLIGEVSGLSPEAPIPILTNPRHDLSLGMSYNFVRNLERFFKGVPIPDENLLFSKHPSDIWNYMDERSGQKLLRVDKINKLFPEVLTFDKVSQRVHDKIKVIIAIDYDTGFLTSSLLSEIAVQYGSSKYLYIDTRKPNLTHLQGWKIKINDIEAAKARKATKGFDDLDLIVTHGKEGSETHDLFVHQKNKVDARDVTGCGETWLATFIYMYHSDDIVKALTCGQHDLEEVMNLANLSASITASHVGTYAPTVKEIVDLYLKTKGV